MKKSRGEKRFLSAVILTAMLGTFCCSDCGSMIFSENKAALVVHAKENEIKVSQPVIKGCDNKYDGMIIRWSEAENAEGYNVYRRTRSTQPWTLLATVPAGTLSYKDNDTMKDGGLYTYMVQAFNGTILSKESAPKTFNRVNITLARVKVAYKQKSAREMLKMINDFRRGPDAWAWNATNTTKVYISGLSRLSYDYALEKIAMTRAAEVAVNFSHERPNGGNCFSALDEAGYVYTAAGENIAYGFKTAKAAFAAFQENDNKYIGQGHRRNMLNKDYNVCAIGHVKVNGVHYWVQEFANTTEDSDYTKTQSATLKVDMEIASEDLSSYKKALKPILVKYKDYPPTKSQIVAAEPAKKKVTLSFTRSVGAQGYEIYRSEKKKTGYKFIKRIGKQDKLTYTDKKLSSKKKYYYYVVPYRISHDTYVYGKKSDVIKVKTR
ncbi:CAP domain-containing protein [Butyrivibrio sp. WCD3002]|uniref:CAP domain-containing protein n=1 Tax=Butyrivibrio sp. WCD3002 TaxID=1280676 RepID=UPI00040F639D|nr:CAP domain-containing protein [Butyrivibrio sp. WCD3002]